MDIGDTLPDIRLPQMSWKQQLWTWADIEQQSKEKRDRIQKKQECMTLKPQRLSFFNIYTYGMTTNRCLFEKKIVGLKMLKTGM